MKEAGAAPAAPGFTAWVGRLIGADPRVFIPFVRAYALIVRRRSRMKFSRGISAKAMGRVTPFHMACVASSVLGIAVVAALGTIQPPLLGAAAAMTFGLLIVVFAVLFDYLDVLTSPDEYRVIAAHPHDAWSVVSAKIFVVGRAIATLSLCFFIPNIVAIGFYRHSALAAGGFALGAALGTFSATLGAMLIGVGILAHHASAAVEQHGVLGQHDEVRALRDRGAHCRFGGLQVGGQIIARIELHARNFECSHGMRLSLPGLRHPPRARGQRTITGRGLA